MWIVWIILALGFIIGNALILLKTANIANLSKHTQMQQREDDSD